MKKLVCSFCAAVMLLCLTSCSSTTGGDSPTVSSTSTTKLTSGTKTTTTTTVATTTTHATTTAPDMISTTLSTKITGKNAKYSLRLPGLKKKAKVILDVLVNGEASGTLYEDAMNPNIYYSVVEYTGSQDFPYTQQYWGETGAPRAREVGNYVVSEILYFNFRKLVKSVGEYHYKQMELPDPDIEAYKMTLALIPTDETKVPYAKGFVFFAGDIKVVVACLEMDKTHLTQVDALTDKIAETLSVG